jgi:hypothetical protein
MTAYSHCVILIISCGSLIQQGSWIGRKPEVSHA